MIELGVARTPQTAAKRGFKAEENESPQLKGALRRGEVQVKGPGTGLGLM